MMEASTIEGTVIELQGLLKGFRFNSGSVVAVLGAFRHVG
jgi:hypothetical protein